MEKGEWLATLFHTFWISVISPNFHKFLLLTVHQLVYVCGWCVFVWL